MKIHIKVLQEHIDKGIKEDSMLCPIGLALDATVGNEVFSYAVETGITRIEWKDPALETIEFDNPEEADRFIENFDNDIPVKPFEFELSDE